MSVWIGPVTRTGRGPARVYDAGRVNFHEEERRAYTRQRDDEGDRGADVRVVEGGMVMGGKKGDEGEPKEGCSVTLLGLAHVPSGGGMWGGARVSIYLRRGF